MRCAWCLALTRSASSRQAPSSFPASVVEYVHVRVRFPCSAFGEGGTQRGAVVDVPDGAGAPRRSSGGGGGDDDGRAVRGGDKRRSLVKVRRQAFEVVRSACT